MTAMLRKWDQKCNECVETDDEHEKILHVFVSSLTKLYKAVSDDQESTEMLERFIEYSEAFKVKGSRGKILPS